MAQVPPSAYGSDTSTHISEFELRALAFADLVERTVEAGMDSAPPAPPAPDPPTDVPLFSTIRCICSDNENRGELVQCHDCHCFLHSACIERAPHRSANFRCPFCALQLDGVDPFRDLRTWVDSLLGELKVLHGLVSEAASIESQISMAAPTTADYAMPTGPMIRGQRQSVPQLRNTLTRTIQEINQHIATLVNQ